MSANNGVIRIGRKGLRKFAFGEDGTPFEVDVVNAFQEWVGIDDQFRQPDRSIKTEDMREYHRAAVTFAMHCAGANYPDIGGSLQHITTAEALDFIARLRECYDEVADFFQPKLLERHDSPGSSEPAFRFSEEEES